MLSMLHNGSEKETLRCYRILSIKFPWFKIPHLRSIDVVKTVHLILVIEWMDIWNVLNKPIQSFVLGKNSHSLALAFSDLMSLSTLVVIIIQETQCRNVGHAHVLQENNYSRYTMYWEHPAFTGDGGLTSVKDWKHLFLFPSLLLAERSTSINHDIHL